MVVLCLVCVPAQLTYGSARDKQQKSWHYTATATTLSVAVLACPKVSNIGLSRQRHALFRGNSTMPLLISFCYEQQLKVATCDPKVILIPCVPAKTACAFAQGHARPPVSHSYGINADMRLLAKQSQAAIRHHRVSSRPPRPPCTKRNS